MFDWLMWFTHMENSKPLALVLFFGVFCGILIYVYTGKQRGQRLESYKYIPLDDDEPPAADAAPDGNRFPSRKVTDHE
jgi:cbb3-type cytochrome oxidase subunit 3